MGQQKGTKPRRASKDQVRKILAPFDPHGAFSPKVKRYGNGQTPHQYSKFKMLDDKSEAYISEVCNKIIPQPINNLDLSYALRPNEALNYLINNMDVMTGDEKIQMFNNCYEKALNSDMAYNIINDKDIAEYIRFNFPNFEFSIQTKISELINSAQFKFNNIASDIMSETITKSDIANFTWLGISEDDAIGLIKLQRSYSDIALAQAILNYIKVNNLKQYCKDIVSIIFNTFKPVFIGMMTMGAVLDKEIYMMILEMMTFNLTTQQIEKIFVSYYKYLIDNRMQQTLSVAPSGFDRLINIKVKVFYDYGVQLF
jgi:hypothetical protein